MRRGGIFAGTAVSDFMRGRGCWRAPALAGLLSLAGAAAAGDAERGRTLAATCLGCHGVPSYTNVYPTYRVPKLGGQHPAYLIAALQAYRSGERRHATMRAHAARFSDAELADIAAYLSALP